MVLENILLSAIGSLRLLLIPVLPVDVPEKGHPGDIGPPPDHRYRKAQQVRAVPGLIPDALGVAPQHPGDVRGDQHCLGALPDLF